MPILSRYWRAERSRRVGGYRDCDAAGFGVDDAALSQSMAMPQGWGHLAVTEDVPQFFRMAAGQC
ncbi:MAG: hypothetical protein PHW60_06725 [Kiritimatiellae bacterium]|nr:hypothetical protein [Kiritimatiellia bacterium]